MTGNGLGLSRRRFLGGAMAAAAGISSGLCNMSVEAQTRSVSALPLDELRAMVEGHPSSLDMAAIVADD